MSADYPVIHFPNSAAFTAWLAEHHGNATGAWLKFAKKGSGEVSVSYQEALEAALCYGWIDGQINKLDDRFWITKFTPRRRRSKWSKRNCGIVEQLIAEGRMQPAGLAEINAAKQDGRWEAAYDSPRNATVPDDLQQAFHAHPRAEEFFLTLTGAKRYTILYQLQDAKRPETRAKRIAKFIKLLEAGDTLV